MAKDLSISLLLDFYGEILTQKQREVVEFYYNEDLSLAEIAEHCGITRQGVRDSIKRAEAQLLDCEDKLGLMKRFYRIQEGLNEIISHATDIQAEGQHLPFADRLREKTRRILEIASEINV